MEENISRITEALLDITTFQPRKDSVASPALIDDIRRAGRNVQVVKVRPKRTKHDTYKYDVIAGHKRVSAIRTINFTLPEKERILVECVVADEDDKTASMDALVDNLLHETLDLTDRDLWIAKLVTDFDYSYQEVVDRLPDMSIETVTNIVRSYRDTSPTIKALLDERKISVGHAKAVASLPFSDQDDIARRLRDSKEWDGPTVRDVEVWAKRARNKNAARAQIAEYLKGLQTNPVKCDDVQDLLKAIFNGGFTYDDYYVCKADIEAASKDSGVDVLFPPLEVSMRKNPCDPSQTHLDTPTAEAETISEPSEESVQEVEETAEPESEATPTPKKRSLCMGCDAFNHNHPDCAHGLLKDQSPGEVTECSNMLPAFSDLSMTKRCLLCDGLTVHMHGSAGYMVHMAGHLGLTTDPTERLYRSHMQCVVDHLIKMKLLSREPCAGCSGTSCPIIRIPHLISFIKQVRLSVVSCGYLSPRTKLKEINRWAVAQYIVAQGKVKEEA